MGFPTHHHSPYLPRSNGKAESGVKIAKNLIKKSARDGVDAMMVLLDWRNTPTSGIGYSQAQRLMSRRTRTSLPIANSRLEPEVPRNVPQKIRNKRNQAKVHYDRDTKELPNWQPDKKCGLTQILIDQSYGALEHVLQKPDHARTKWMLMVICCEDTDKCYVLLMNYLQI